MSSTYFRQDFLTVPDGASLFFEVRGEGGVPAILCDGLGCDGFVWKYLWPPLTARRRVMHWHYRGHGASGVPDDLTRIGMTFSCDDLARLMDHLQLESAVLFGHSMGTQVALEFHRRYRDRVKGLALVCGSYGTPLDTWHDHTLMRVAFPPLMKLIERFPRVAKAITNNLMGTELALDVAIRGELNPDLIAPNDFAPYMKHLQKMDPVMFVRTLDSLKDHSALDHLAQVDVPTLVIGGEIDKFTPVWLAQRTAELIPHAEYLLVPGGSHTAPLERPGLVNHTIDRWLREKVDAHALRKAG
ncbi:MAG: alpha/beta hydrolase [Archangiaceae bacterium]|nr:alpha/beta hydrolase [Archangiaceae bacterium]